MEKIKAILIDDELNSLQNLQQKLEGFCPDISIVAVTQKPEEGILLIRQYQPDVVFLDIEMPKMSGFRMLEELGEYDFDIIFTTAYNHYSIDAIRISAFDYLVKPIPFHRFLKSVVRAQQINNPAAPVQAVSENVPTPEVEQDFMFVRAEYENVKMNFSS